MSKDDEGFVAPPLPGYFDAQDHGDEWCLFWKLCGAGWALAKTSDNPGNLLRMAGSRPRPRQEGGLVMSEAAERSPALEIEAGSIREFFQLLELHEGHRAHGALLQVEPIPRRAIFIDQLHATATMKRSAGCRWWVP